MSETIIDQPASEKDIHSALSMFQSNNRTVSQAEIMKTLGDMLAIQRGDMDGFSAILNNNGEVILSATGNIFPNSSRITTIRTSLNDYLKNILLGNN